MSELAVIKKTLKPYRLVTYYNEVRLATNQQGSWDTTGLTLEKGWVTVDAGWLVQPKEFAAAHPGYCIFSKMEPYWFASTQTELVEAWLYTPTVRPFFYDKEDRKLFRCFVDPNCLYELALT